MPAAKIFTGIRLIHINRSERLIVSFLILLFFAFPDFVTGGDYRSFSAYKTSDRELTNNNIDYTLIESAIIHFTNLERNKFNLTLCVPDNRLKQASYRHSREMVRLQYFSHRSPVAKNRELLDRLKQTNFTMSNIIVAENIGVDYLLRIAKRPFYTSYRDGKLRYIDAGTHQVIGFQTHIEFARDMVQQWMNSPAHRKNILNPKFNLIGVGIAKGPYQDVQALYVTQNFCGPLTPTPEKASASAVNN